ncbi:DUF1576 domain-containing protein [Clostridium boliviensis]|uniref:DUF1576 domain-containing protein n=1 Tax=Clostridium boliviensis TaxID=318465 RepID=A0ABU4GI82_9CLOT|nr:DUF1576 domain-containing protein [Clostridium boliviensis]MDW2797320.1 DUF1576 domain-containing protein [Clostridium boliviensis]
MTGQLSVRFRTYGPLSRRAKFQILALVPIYFIVAGFLLQPFDEIWRGIITIVQEPDFLITDYIAIGGIGAAFINAGVLTLLSIAIVYFLGMDMSGHTITSSFLMFGFSLFGKNILNIWAIMMGICLYSYYHKTSITRYIYVGFYGTCLSPVITQIMQIGNLPLGLRLVLSFFVGISIGFVLPPLSTHTHYAHQGYSLYNVGFSCGIIATIIVSLMKSFGIEIKARLIWSTGQNVLFARLLIALFFGMIVFSFFISKQVWTRYLEILKSYGISGTDYVKSEGFAPTLFNMGINGIVSTLLVLIVRGDLNGPTIGGIFTIVGFSATGKHTRNILPIMIGVIIGGYLKNWSITDPSAQLALLLSTTLAPIAGEFGVGAGILAGFLHSSAALNVGIVYGGLNLYNNGFAGGLIATFLVPVLKSIRDRKAHAKTHVSL